MGDMKEPVSETGVRPCILELMRKRPVIGDGAYVFTLEKRGYVLAGCWTPEVVLEHPEAVRGLHREYLRAGADVIQAFSFYANEGKMDATSGTTGIRSEKNKDINTLASEIAHSVADPAGKYVSGGLSPTPTFKDGKGDMDKVRQEFSNQIDILKNQNVDLLLGEFFAYCREAEIAVAVMKQTDIPVAVTIRTGPTGDMEDISPQDCAVRLCKAGADIIGLNCQYDPDTTLQTLKLMKEGLAAEGLNPLLMLQPVGFHCPEKADDKEGYHHLPEFPFSLEPRTITRFEARRFAREAYDLGVRYIGGCCGFESHHIREMAEELAPEIGHRPLGQSKNGEWGSGLIHSQYEMHRVKASRQYWEHQVPGTGRKLRSSSTTVRPVIESL